MYFFSEFKGLMEFTAFRAVSCLGFSCLLVFFWGPAFFRFKGPLGFRGF